MSEISIRSLTAPIPKSIGKTITFYLGPDTVVKFEELKSWLKIKKTSILIQTLIRLFHFLVSSHREGWTIKLVRGKEEKILKLE